MANLVDSIFQVITSFFSGGGFSIILPFAFMFALCSCFDIFLSLLRGR